jgi:hypothetical protein
MVVTGNELYAAARSKALGEALTRPSKTPGEPDPDGVCACTGADPLPHTGRYHHLLSVVKRGPRTWCCSIGTDAGPCPCNAFTPRPRENTMAENQPRYIVTRTDGKPVPPDEPCFVIRGQDMFAIRAVSEYIELTRGLVDPEVTGQLIVHLERLRAWRTTHTVKIPD